MTSKRPFELCLLLLVLPLSGCALFRSAAVPVHHDLVQLESGLSFEEVIEGVGRPALPEDEVTIDYTGWLEDGTRFDSSLDRGIPITFTVERAPLLGWREGIPGMKAGGRRRLELPSELAYGAEGVPGLVPPDTGLVFIIELLEIAGEEPPAQPPRSQRLEVGTEEAAAEHRFERPGQGAGN